MRGILLTLATVVLLVLMTAELITYVYMSVNYQSIESVGQVSTSGYLLVSKLDGQTSSFLHESVQYAIGAIGNYEADPRPGSNTMFINNTGYAIGSLVENGTLYGTNMITQMGGATIINYTNSIVRQARLQNINMIITNSSFLVYMQKPFEMNATFSAIATMNSSSGSFSYPVIATALVSLNGTTDIYGMEDGNSSTVVRQGAYPGSMQVGNAFATSGSRSPFLFAYGPIVTGSFSSCSAIPSRFQNYNYILAVPDDSSLGSCGMGGVITYSAYTTGYSVPYLVYPSGSNVISLLHNGTSMLLDGQGLELLNLSGMYGAVSSDKYFPSYFAPSYLGWAQGQPYMMSQEGIFSFRLMNRLVPSFLASQDSYIAANISGLPAPPDSSISAWIMPTGPMSSRISEDIAGEEAKYKIDTLSIWIGGTTVYFGSNSRSCKPLSYDAAGMLLPGSWYNIVGVYNQTGQSTLYINGNAVASSSITAYCSGGAFDFLIGNGEFGYFNGSIANVQWYNSSLSPAQVAQAYYSGVDGMAQLHQNLTGWWPLDGNAKDYSGRAENGNAFNISSNSIGYQLLRNYYGDPVSGGALYSGNLTQEVEGIFMCGSLDQCSNGTVQHLYLGNRRFNNLANPAVAEAGAFGLSNALLPDVAVFNGQSGYIGTGAINTGQVFTVSAWVLPEASGGSRGIIGQSDASNNWNLEINGNSYDFSVYGVKDNSFGTVVPGQWAFLTAVYDSGSVNLYINGQPATSYSESATLNPYSLLYMGTSPGGHTNPSFFNGSIADVQIYESALSNAQVEQLYLNDSILGVSPSNSWPLSNGYLGLQNITENTANSMNYAVVIGQVTGECYNWQAINRLCGVWFSPT